VVRRFATGLDQIIVVESKRSFLEDAIKVALYGRPDAPRVCGKLMHDGRPLFPATGDLDAGAIADGMHRALQAAGLSALVTPPAPRQRVVALPIATRTPFFCSGCPHNSSTQAAPGALVGGGIGCHAMLLLMPGDRAGEVTGLSQMGGEGAQWLGMAPFVAQRHFVQNIGDGTFAHSGSLAVRAAVAAGVNVTFKLLRNSAVAMTGGQQPIGEIALRPLVELLRAEGVRRVVVTTDEPERVRALLGRQCEVRHRDDVLGVQQDLADVEGVTVLIHDQECAAEKRRKRRRGRAAIPDRRVVINERVCEGCGDCGATSNCLSVQPADTEFGRKTRINQSSCNLDFSCLHGDCPSFMTVVPGERPSRAIESRVPPHDTFAAQRTRDFSVRITGIGGTGVVTVSQVLATAAAIEGRFVRALDQTGLAQKGGAVVSDLVVTSMPAVRSPKLASGECDLYLGCDLLVAVEPDNLRVVDAGRTTAVVSAAEVPTGAMVIDPGARYPERNGLVSVISERVHATHLVDAAALALHHLGDEQYANMVLVGAAFQSGVLALGAAAVERAIELNGAAVDSNIAAFRLGRWAVAEPAAVATIADAAVADAAVGSAGIEPDDLDSIVARRFEELVAYQDRGYADQYAAVVTRVRDREAWLDVGPAAGRPLTTEVAHNLYKLMAYKDEYEVARLALDPKVAEEITEQFGTGARITYHLHPPALRALGMARKITLGPWFRLVFRLLVALRPLRKSRLDPFGRGAVRRAERQLIVEYQVVLDRLLAGLTETNHALAVEIAGLPDMVRGYEEIKLRNVAAYRARCAELVEEYEATPASECAAANSIVIGAGG
jgi:indolepyruvate ferredoxin oxidoreductase